MVLRRKLRSTVRKVWKKPGLLKGTGSISRTPAIKSLGRKHLQQTLSCESFPLQGVQSANIWGLKWSQCSLCLKPTQTSSSARRTPHTIASLVTNSFPYVVEPCASRGMKMIAGSFLFAILPPTSLAPDACCSAVTHLSLVLGSFEPAVLRSAWCFPIGFPHNVVANRAPGTPAGTPSYVSTHTAWTSTPSDVLFLVPMTPPELLDHLLPPGTPVGVWRLRSVDVPEKIRCVLQLHALKPYAAWQAKYSCPEPLEPFIDRPSCPRSWTHHQTRLDPAWKEVASQSQSDLPHRLGESLQAQIAECGPWLGSPPKKRPKQNGKWQWTKPSFVKMKTHKLPGGKRLKVKCGTQHIDRCWKFIKERLAKGAHVQAAPWLWIGTFVLPNTSIGIVGTTRGPVQGS